MASTRETAASAYHLANTKTGTILPACNLLLIHLIQLCLKYKVEEMVVSFLLIQICYDF